MTLKIFKKSLLLISIISVIASFDVQADSYLFAPGIHSGPEQVARYCTRYEMQNLGTVSTPYAIQILDAAKTSFIHFDDLVLSTTSLSSLYELIYHYIVHYRERQNHHRAQLKVKKNKDAKKLKRVIKVSNISFGQGDEIEKISNSYDEHCILHSDECKVAIGISRGAVALFNFLATAYHTKEKKFIKAIILESCFDSTRSMVTHKIKSMPLCIKKIAVSLFGLLFPGHDIDGIQPIKVITHLPKIPVLLVTSKKDTVVSAQCTWNMYYALKKQGFDTHILELNHAEHARYMIDNAEDRTLYKIVVHAFYAHYGLDHDPELAAKGKKYFGQTQP